MTAKEYVLTKYPKAHITKVINANRYVLFCDETENDSLKVIADSSVENGCWKQAKKWIKSTAQPNF